MDPASVDQTWTLMFAKWAFNIVKKKKKKKKKYTAGALRAVVPPLPPGLRTPTSYDCRVG
eukprot:scaffold123316_cov65-Phaeocystis_antarctica.AAC.2